MALFILAVPPFFIDVFSFPKRMKGKRKKLLKNKGVKTIIGLMTWSLVGGMGITFLPGRLEIFVKAAYFTWQGVWCIPLL